MLAADLFSDFAINRGDFDGDQMLTASDIDQLSDAVRTGDSGAQWDVNGDGQVSPADRDDWIFQLQRTYYGDANLDGVFGTTDLVAVFQLGQYEDGVAGNSTWAAGDWNGDGDFGTGDLVVAFQGGGFEAGKRALADAAVQLTSASDSAPVGDYRTVFPEITLTGSATPFTTVQLSRDISTEGDEVETETLVAHVDGAGHFELPDVHLREGENHFELFVADGHQHESRGELVIDLIPSSLSRAVYSPWGEWVNTDLTDQYLPSSMATAFIPQGTTRFEIWKEASSALGATKPIAGRPGLDPGTTPDNIVELEDAGAVGGNDTLDSAQPVDNFGSSDGASNSTIINGTLLPVPTILPTIEDDGDITRANATGLTSNTAVIVNGRIGDGPYGSTGIGTGDFDFFSVDMTAGQTLLVDVNTPNDSPLDSIVFVYSADGTRVDASDDDGVSTDSFLRFKALTDGEYFVSIAGWGSFGPVDPMDSSSGIGASSEGDYSLVLGLDLIEDVDNYVINLEEGDVFSAALRGGGTHLTLYDYLGNELFGSSQDATYIFPEDSTLVRDGNAAVSWLADQTGTYFVSVDEGVGNYQLEFGVSRPTLEQQHRGDHQVLFLDFDGAEIQPLEVFGFGNATASLSPLSEFLPRWGLTGTDEQAVIDAIVNVVQENFDDIGLSGINGDRRTDGIDGHFDFEIVTSRDATDARGFPFDYANDSHVTRLIIGGTVDQLGVNTIGLAESIDVGNLSTDDTAVVLLDLLSGPSFDVNSLNGVARAPGVGIIDLIGRTVGNIATHEAGHVLGSWHTNPFNALPQIMDQGGNFATVIGYGPDKIFGNADDIDIDFGTDQLVANEGFTGIQRTASIMAFGMSTGTVDAGFVVQSSTPGNNRQVHTPPTEFVIQFLDEYDPDEFIDASSLTVNGLAADSVEQTSPTSLTFVFATSPVTSEGLQSMSLAEDALVRLSDGTLSAGYDAIFGYDAQLMEVVSAAPPDGIVSLPLEPVVISFNEPFDPASVSVDDVLVSRGHVESITILDDRTLEVQLGGINAEGLLTLTLPDGAITDAYGNFSRGVTRSYTLEFGEVPFTIPLDAKLPLGSLIYDPVMQGRISTSADTDTFLLSVDPGQSLSLHVTTDTILQGRVELFRDGHLLSTIEAAEPGQTLIIQNDPATGRLIDVTGAPSEFAIRVTGIDGSLGGYEVQVALNSAFEEELHTLVANDTLQTSQELETAFRSLRAKSPDIASVLGEISGQVIAADDLESGELSSDWTVFSSSDFGRTQVTGDYGTANGEYALLMDVTKLVTPNINEAIWTVNTSATETAILSFAHASFGDESDNFPAEPYTGQAAADGISVSLDGQLWYPVFSPPNLPLAEWHHFEIDLAYELGQYGVSLGDSLRIKFQQYDNSPLVRDGRGWDAISLRTEDLADWYHVRLARNDRISVAAAVQNQGDVSLALFDSSGNLVAEGLRKEAQIRNGSFEAGTLSGWQTGSTGPSGSPWLVAGPLSGGNVGIDFTDPQDGNYVAWNEFDGDGPLQTSLTQDFTVPTGTPEATLKWKHRVQWVYLEADAEPKTFSVEIRDPATDEVLQSELVVQLQSDSGTRFGDTGWVDASLDLSEYAGQAIRIAFVQYMPQSFAGPAQIELDAIEFDAGLFEYDNVNDVVSNVDIASAGDYYVRVTGTNRTDYGLVLTRNVGFGLEKDDTLETAQAIGSPSEGGRRWVLGHVGAALDTSDFYSIQVNGNGPLTIETFTPAGSEGEFVNKLDVLIRVYDAQGNLVASDDNSGEANNASLRYRAPRDQLGTYYIEVALSDATPENNQGEYVLSISGGDIEDPTAIAADLADAALADDEVWVDDLASI